MGSVSFTAVYGSPNATLRKHLWTSLTEVARLQSGPWIVAGDFNAILHSGDRTGGVVSRARGCGLFRHFLFNSGLLDLGFSGPKYTWRWGTLLQRLDRALGNTSLLNWFSNTTVQHLPKLSSNQPINQAAPAPPATSPSSPPKSLKRVWDYLLGVITPPSSSPPPIYAHPNPDIPECKERYTNSKTHSTYKWRGWVHEWPEC